MFASGSAISAWSSCIERVCGKFNTQKCTSAKDGKSVQHRNTATLQRADSLYRNTATRRFVSSEHAFRRAHTTKFKDISSNPTTCPPLFPPKKESRYCVCLDAVCTCQPPTHPHTRTIRRRNRYSHFRRDSCCRQVVLAAWVLVQSRSWSRPCTLQQNPHHPRLWLPSFPWCHRGPCACSQSGLHGSDTIVSVATDSANTFMPKHLPCMACTACVSRALVGVGVSITP